MNMNKMYIFIKDILRIVELRHNVRRPPPLTKDNRFRIEFSSSIVAPARDLIIINNQQ
jgi:hypothetical protein